MSTLHFDPDLLGINFSVLLLNFKPIIMLLYLEPVSAQNILTYSAYI
jgi:hypothetical protein